MEDCARNSVSTDVSGKSNRTPAATKTIQTFGLLNKTQMDFTTK